ncbi:MAG: hypothetical protein ABT940_08315 [Alphaproteobacteria bacterium]
MILLTNQFNAKGLDKTVIGLEVLQGEPIRCMARIQEQGVQYDDPIDNSDLYMAMLEYCSDVLIPIPRSARKGVHKSEHGLFFDIVVEEPPLIALGVDHGEEEEG